MRWSILVPARASLALAAALTACSRPTEPNLPPPSGMVEGQVVAQDGSRTPRVLLLLERAGTRLEQETDAGGVFVFPPVARGIWTLSLGPLPTTWKLAPGQEATREVTVREGATSLVELVLLHDL